MAQGDSVYQTSDEIYDHLCSICEEHNTMSEALFCCNRCTKLLCIACKQHHDQLYKNHNVLDKGKVDQWVIQKAVSTDMCEIHHEKVWTCSVKTMTKFAATSVFQQIIVETARFQILAVAAYGNIKGLDKTSCKQVKHIPDVAKGIHQKPEFLDMLTSVSQLQDRLNTLRQRKQFNKKQVQKESAGILIAVNSLKQRINKILDVLEQNTKQLVDSLLKDLEKNLQDDIEACQSIHDGLKTIVDKINKQGKFNETSAFCGLKYCKKKNDDAEKFLQSVQDTNSTLTFTPNKDIEQFLALLDSLGEITSNLGIVNVKMFNIKIREDRESCSIWGVCLLPDGNSVIVDGNNNNVKLLDRKYSVIDQCGLPRPSRDVCHIADGEVAVTVCEIVSNRHEIQFINTVNGKLSRTRTIKLDHTCICITHHGGQLYIGGDGLYIYTVTGTLVKKLYTGLVYCVAVSDDGKRIYMTLSNNESLITLDDTGNVLSTLQDPDLKYTTGVAVTSTRTVLVCGRNSNTILQVDRDGKRKISTIATSSDGVDKPRSLCFNRKTNELIVGQQNDQMLVIKLN